MTGAVRSATPGPGTAPPGPSSSRRPPGPLPGALDGLRPGHRAAGALRRRGRQRSTRRHLDLERHHLDQQSPGHEPPGPGRGVDGLRPGHRADWSSSAATAAPADHCWTTPGPGTAPPGPSSRPATSPPPADGASWPTTRPPGNMVLFGGRSPVSDELATTPGPGTAPPGPSSRPATSPPARVRRLHGLRPGHRAAGPLRRARRQWLASTTPGPGTAPPGPSCHPTTSPTPATAPRWPTTRPPALVLFGGSDDSGGDSRRHLDLERHDLDRASPATSPPPATAPRWPTTRPPASWSSSGAAPAAISPTPGPGTAPPGPSCRRPPRRPPASARWPTTRPPPTWCSSGVSRQRRGRHLDLERGHWTELFPATSPPERFAAADGLRPGHRRRGALRRAAGHLVGLPG